MTLLLMVVVGNGCYAVLRRRRAVLHRRAKLTWPSLSRPLRRVRPTRMIREMTSCRRLPPQRPRSKLRHVPGTYGLRRCYVAIAASRHYCHCCVEGTTRQWRTL